MMKFWVSSVGLRRAEDRSAAIGNDPQEAISTITWKYVIGFWPFRPTGTTILVLTMTISASRTGQCVAGLTE